MQTTSSKINSGIKARQALAAAILGYGESYNRSWLEGCWTLLTEILYPKFTFYLDHKKVLEKLLREPNYLYLAARGSGKTSVGTAVRIWRSLKFPFSRTGLCANTEGQAVKILDLVHQQWRHNDILKALYPKMYDWKRSKQSEVWYTVRRISKRSEPTIWCAGISGQWAQKHFEFLDLDDIVDSENSLTAKQREGLHLILANTIYPTLIDWRCKQKLAYGTRYYVDDEWQQMLDIGIPSNTWCWDILNEYGKSKYPEVLSDEFLAEKKKLLGSAHFDSQYRMQPWTRTGHLIKNEWLRTYKGLEAADLERTIISIDLAASKDETADYTVFSVIGVKKGRYYICDIVRGHWSSLSEAARAASRLLEDYDISMVLCEQVGVQALAVEYFRELWGLPTIGIKKTKDKIYYLNMVLPLFEAGQVYIRQDLNNVLDELRLFPYAPHDDIVDTISQGLGYLLKRARGVRPVRIRAVKRKRNYLDSF